MQQQLLQDPIYCRKKLKKNPKNSKKVFKKIQKSKLGNFRFQLDWKLGFRVIAKNCKPEKGGTCWPQRAVLPAFSLCLLLIDGATGCYYLPSAFACHSYTFAKIVTKKSESRYNVCHIWITHHHHQKKLKKWKFYKTTQNTQVFSLHPLFWIL